MIKKTSIWQQGIKKPEYKFFTGEKETDVLVVGAGITGLTTAYLLSKQGKKVTIVDMGEIVSGDTKHTTGFLSWVSDTDLSKLAKEFGIYNAELVWLSMQQAISKIENIITEENIDCEFGYCPLYYFAHQAADKDFLFKEYELSKKLNFKPNIIENEKIKYAIEFENNAKIHPLKYLYGLAQKIVEMGGEIYENTKVLEYKHFPNVLVKTDQGIIKADHIVIATHNPNNWAFEIHTRIFPMQTYVIAGECEKKVLQEALYIDTYSPYYYLRIDQGEFKDRFLLGGGDHHTGEMVDVNDIYNNLEKYLLRFYKRQQFEITNQWSGQIISTADGLPFIGEYMLAPSHILSGTGFSGDGLIFGTLSAIMVTDKILENINPLNDLYTTKRLKGFKKILKANYNFAKNLIVERIKTKKEDISQMPDSFGKVIKQKNKQIAIYKDENGKVFKMSAVCTHLGCIVQWNDQAKTWDCPCHGSRFDKFGKVISGPAKKDLKKF